MWDYVYDTGNRLKTATGPGVAAVYAYGPLGRRSMKSGTGVVTTQFLSDGIEEIADYDGNGALLRRYVHGPGVDELVVMCDGTLLACGGRQYYHANWQGSIVAMSSASGAMLDQHVYGPYGETDDPTGNPFRYTSRRIDAETGLYYYRARYYSPILGRFLQTDPIGYRDQMNLYAYVGNDPVNNTDPSGEICIFLPGSNGASNFCQRSLRYAQIGNDPRVSSKTTFFAAASAVTNALASVTLLGSRLAVSGETANFLEFSSSLLEDANIAVAEGIRNGTIFSSGTIAENDAKFVRSEQGIVQAALDQLMKTDSEAFERIVGEINGTLNSDLSGAADPNFASALADVRTSLGGDIDFRIQGDREAIGLELTKREREGNPTCRAPTGTRIRTC